MRLRALLLTPALIAAALGLGVDGASAAGLYTTSARTATVALGTAASATATTTTTTTIVFTSGTTQVNFCSGSTLGLVVRQNSGGTVIGAVTSGSFSGCIQPTTPNFVTPWTFTVRGSGEASTSSTVFTTVSLDSFSYTFVGGTYTGNLVASSPGDPPVNGTYASQPATAAAPVCIVFNNAGTVVGPLTSNEHVTGRYCFEGHPASTYSLG